MQPKASSLVFLQYLTTVFDNLEDSILLIGIEPEGKYRLLLANGSFLRSTGYVEAHIGKYVSDVVPARTYEHLSKQYRKVVITKKPTQYTDWFETDNGRQAYKIKLIPILNTIGECMQIAAICTNITELLRLREELKNKTPPVA